MTATLLASPGLETAAALHVERTDIVFHNSSPERVGIEIAVYNPGDQRSEPTVAALMAAPLGAFVPWRPLALLPVPALEPGDSQVLRTEAVRVAPAPLGPPDRVSPRQLLTALGFGDPRPDRNPPSVLGQAMAQTLGGQLPADLMELLGRGNPHWAGNLNVFIGSKAVERHLAQALRIYPGRVNIAMFCVGERRDAYAFHLEGDGADWDAALYDMTTAKTLAFDPRHGDAIPANEWIRLTGPGTFMLALCPPEDCGRGSVEVHVRQRSTGQSAVVEFSLDPNAAGAGCYVV